MATVKLVKRALEMASAAQLIRVRAVIGIQYRGPGNDSAGPAITEALAEFDKGNYGFPGLAKMLPDEELGEALR
jgi:hypothetical protein